MADGDETTEETPVEEATSEEAAPEENDEVQAAADEPGEAADEAPAPSKEKDAGSQDHEGADLPDWIWLEPHQEGLFGTEDDARDQATISSDEAAIDDKFKEAARNKLAMGMVLACVCFIVGGFAMIQSSDAWSRDLQCFVDGTLEECKTAEVERTKRLWRDEDHKAANRYGDMTLVYFPPDSQVKLNQEKTQRSGDDWRNREGLPECMRPEGMAVETPTISKEPEIKDIPNDSQNLKEGQTIERLPLLDMPIFEASKDGAGCVNVVSYYNYKIVLSREGYHPREFDYRPDDWTRVGPGNMMIEWPGVDLEPKPETIKANFAKVMAEEFCLRKLKELATLSDSMQDPNFEMMLMRNGFKTKEDFMKAFEALTTTAEHDAWWQEQAGIIAKLECQEAGEK